MVDNLLDLLTGGEHRKTKRILEERRKLRNEEERIRQLLEGKPVSMQGMSRDKIHSVSSFPPGVKVDFAALKSLSDIGIDIKFLDDVGEYYLFLKNSAQTKQLMFVLDNGLSVYLCGKTGSALVIWIIWEQETPC
jgi:bromodomain-containing protein 7/9